MDSRDFVMGLFGRKKYDSDGFDIDGYDEDGFDKDGWHWEDSVNKETGTKYDVDGFDIDGYDEDGFDEWGFDKDGYDKDGFDNKGIDRDGCDKFGIKKTLSRSEYQQIREYIEKKEKEIRAITGNTYDSIDIPMNGKEYLEILRNYRRTLNKKIK